MICSRCDGLSIHACTMSAGGQPFEEEPKLLQTLARTTGLDLVVRDDPMMRLDEFRMMSRPAGRDVTELYAVA